MSHTPGPWRIVDREILEDGSIYPAHIVGAKDIEIVHIETNIAVELSQQYPDSIWTHNAKRDSNARLIAAAPDLLDALKYARRFLKKEDVDVCFIDAAIARAESI